jgi:putative hydrolase of the HAD superfamily
MIALPRAILFDLDDTIIASGRREPLLLAVAESFADELGGRSVQAVADQASAGLGAFFGDPERLRTHRFTLAEGRRAAITEAFAPIGLGEDLATRFSDRFAQFRDEATDYFPKARQTIEALKERGLALALVTNGAADIQRAKVERFDLARLFDHVQIEGEHGFGKPEDQAYLHAMQALGVEARDTWMVGDNLEWEVAAPQRLGIFAIWHDGHRQGLPPGSTVRPDRIIHNLSELLEAPRVEGP